MAAPITLGETRGRYSPDYQLTFYRDGDPRRPLPASQVNLRSLVALQTSKSVNDLSGTFTITLKDGRARHRIREMDVVRIRLRGHGDPRLVTVLKGVVDESRAGGSADPYASSEDTVITGRCTGKYLQVTSLFLPVWDPTALLPTALTFGLGDAAKKVGGNRPYDIFRYLVRKYTYGERDLAGVSGIPNSRYWLDHQTRFGRSSVDFRVPYLQFNEDSVAQALKSMEVLGFTETWVDELGRIVYRHPAWDAPVAYRLSTNELMRWSLNRSDVDASTYVEVVPAGDPGIDSATAQALRAGRAPVPSSYLRSSANSLQHLVDPQFVIETDTHGKPTATGRENRWYKLQRRLGLRPMQISSPLLFTQAQAQAQAEGLLRFLTRMAKGGSVTIPGNPLARLGYTLLLHGELDGVAVNRTYYVEGVQHDFVWGEGYTTSLTLSHGRDPWDPQWKAIALPKFDPAQLAADGGVLDGSGDVGDVPLVAGSRAKLNADGTASAPKDAPAAIARMIAKANSMIGFPYAWGGGHPTVGKPSRSTRAGESQIGYDCSGATAAVLDAGHAWKGGTSAAVSGAFGGVLDSGPGRWVTVYFNASHVFMVIAGLRFDTSRAGGVVAVPGGTGPRWTDKMAATDRYSVAHPTGL